jgi:hypothetical protein
MTERSCWKLWANPASVLLCLVSCTQPPSATNISSSSQPSTGSSRGENAGDAQTNFARFLSLAVATRSQVLGMFDSVYARGDPKIGGDVDPCPEDYREVRWLADYKIVSVDAKNDSAVGVAVLTTVADQMPSPDGADGVYLVTPRLRQDTARFTLIRSPETHGHWAVCGDAQGGFGLLRIGREVRWPPGWSKEKAFEQIDSVRKARGLPILR